MLDIKFIRENLIEVKEMLKKRRVEADLNHLIEIDEKRLELQQKIEKLRQDRNLAAKKKEIEWGKKIKGELEKLEPAFKAVEEEEDSYLEAVPNMLSPEVPEGEGDGDNKEIKRWGEQPGFDFKPLDHVELGKQLNLIDFERGAKVAGNKFYFLKGDAVLLEFALIDYAMKQLQKEGFVPFRPPDLVKPEIASGVGFQPRGPEAQVYTIEKENLSLIGTAEIPLGGYHAGEILDEKVLPLKYLGFSPCFRTEAGSYGRVSYGLYRVHQFDKLEIFIYCNQSESEKIHEYILSLEEKLFQGLELPYRVVDVCTGDLGAPAYRKFDVEAWMPGRPPATPLPDRFDARRARQGGWGEVTSTSNTTDYQARRLNIKYRRSDGKVEFVHTLNGTALAISRTLIAILENYQRKDGSVEVPQVLQAYVGKKVIEPIR
ncbi:MAG: serine--tRNA ligase [Candidatus Woykebacteria bacterium RBG_13_40_7b]|uniref:Serine--tRNA ligase n=1 Tax=Candidatus Woykebacteria bacterium RBG_13_40_7b TaxID=1802594 RepID=A0A1G1WAE1_9BACT|nr:MAG: serine--tRNA ligase [Candidatus Woykebacteria bacterium RBG_13_40_7b]